MSIHVCITAWGLVHCAGAILGVEYVHPEPPEHPELPDCGAESLVPQQVPPFD